jgi:hypothetical protein
MTGATSARLLFLSHAGADSQRALELAANIEASPDAQCCGLKVWIDKKALVPGSSWQEQLEQAIAKHSTAFGILLTREGARNWVRMEVRVALDRVIATQQGGMLYPFIPIVADDVADIALLPAFARQYQGVRLGADGGGLKQLIRVAAGIDQDAPVALVNEPFMGLEAFEADSAALFFGRNDETAELVSRLNGTNFVMVVGDSGSGKSSLVKAGLVPAFREGVFADPLAKRPELTDWHVVEMRPGRDAFAGLAEGVERAARKHGKPAADIGTFNDWVRSTVPAKVHDALRLSGPDGATLLLVVDQFEELWTQEVNPERRSSFLDALLVIAEPGVMQRRVVGTMRRDYYHLTGDHDGLRARLAADNSRARYLLGAMTEAGLRDAVEKPLELAGVTEQAAQALADEIVRDIAGQPGNLALVEMALTETWRRRHSCGGDLSLTYERIGRLEGALATAAEDIFWNSSGHPNKLAEAERSVAEAIFMRLARVGDAGGATRRIVRWSELEPVAKGVARKLTTKDCSRLLVIRHPGQDERDQSTDADAEPTVELAHEQLITQWRDYRAWLRGTGIARHAADPERAKDKRALDRLIDTAEIWRERGQSEADLARGGDLEDFAGLLARRESWLSPAERNFVSDSQDAFRRAADEHRRQLKLARRRTWVSAAAAVVFLGLGAVAAWKWSEADKQATIAKAESAEKEKQRAEADRQKRLAEEQLSRANDALALGIWSDLNPPGNASLNAQYRNALWRLARDRGGVRDAFIQHLADGWTNQLRFGAVALPIARALGFDRPGPEEAKKNLEIVVEAISETEALDQVRTLAQEASVLAGKLTPEQAAVAFEATLNRLKNTERSDRVQAQAQALHVIAAKLEPQHAQPALMAILGALRGTKSGYQAEALAQELATLAGRLTPERAAAALGPVFALFHETDDFDHLWPLTQAVQLLASHVSTEQAQGVLAEILDAMREMPVNSKAAAFADVVPSLLERLPPQRALALLPPALEAFRNAYASDEFASLERAMQIFAGKLATDLAPAAQGPIVDAMLTTEDTFELPVLAKTLRWLHVTLAPDRVQAVLGSILSRMQAAAKDTYKLRALARTLQELSTPLTPEQAQAALATVLDAMRTDPDPGSLWVLAQALRMVPATPLPEQAQSALAIVLDAIGATRNAFELQLLAETVQVLSVTPEQAQGPLEHILDVLKGTNKPGEVKVLAQAVQALPVTLEPEQALTVLGRIIQAILDKTDPDQLQALAQPIPALAGKLTPELAFEALGELIEARSADSSALRAQIKAQASRALADKVTPQQVQQYVDQFLSMTHDGRMQSFHPLLVGQISQSLQALADKLTLAQARAVLPRIVDWIATTEEPSALRDLAAAVTALAAKLTAEQARAALPPVRSALAWASSDDEAAVWTSAFAELLLRVPEPSRVAEIVEVLKYPMAGGTGTEVLLDALQRADASSPGKDTGLEANLDWLRQAYPTISLDAAPACPEPPRDRGLSCPKARPQ